MDPHATSPPPIGGLPPHMNHPHALSQHMQVQTQPHSPGESASTAQGQGSPVEDGQPQMLTIRFIMQGKEVGSIIGKKGDNIKKCREESGAKINISDGSCPERIVTLTGVTENICKAASMICKKFEDDLQQISSSGLPKPPVTLRLIVPASQCGSLIGKGGSKIKEIREVTGASIQVASEMLPNSTERAVTISGTSEAITQCIFHVCNVMLESPPKGTTIPYRPKPAIGPIIFAGGAGQAAYALAAQQFAVPQPHDLTKLQQLALPHALIPGQGLNPAGLPNAMAPMPFPRTDAPTASPQTTAEEVPIPNDLIGSIIGRGGSKINEIRMEMHKALLASSAAPHQMSVQNTLLQGVPALQPPLPPALSSSSTSTIASSSVTSSFSPSSLPTNQSLSTQINHSSATGISSSTNSNGLTSNTVSTPATSPQPTSTVASAPAAAVAVAAAAAAQAQAQAAFMAAGAGHPNLPGISHGTPSPNPMQHVGLSMNVPQSAYGSTGFNGVPTLYSHPSMIPSSPQPGCYIPNSVVNSPTLSPHNISFSSPRLPFLPGFGPGVLPFMGHALSPFPGAPPPPPNGPQVIQTIPQSSPVPSTMLVGDINTLKKQQQALTGKIRPGVIQQNGMRSKFSPY